MKPQTPPIHFEPQRRAGDKELKAAIKSFVRHLESEEHRLGLRKRQRRDVDRHSFVLAVEAVACNLLITAMVGTDARLSVPRSHAAIWRKARYRDPVYGQHFLDILDVLAKLKLIKTITRGYRFSQHARQPTTVRPTAKLAKHLPVSATDWNSFHHADDTELVILKKPKALAESADGERNDQNPEIDYPETRNTKRWRREVKAINAWLRAAPIEFLGNHSRVRLDRDGQPIDPHRRMLRRVFNNDNWNHGGRLWGGFWMNMERAERFDRIRIDNEPIANVDYNALFPRFAYALAGAEQPTDDIYDIEDDGSCRDGWKKLINAMLFVAKPLTQWPKDTRADLPIGTNIAYAVFAIKRKHAAIASLFERGIGYRLMRTESDVLISVVTALFKAGITALPLHDSVLVARSHAKTAMHLMEEEFMRRSGASRAFVKIEETPN